MRAENADAREWVQERCQGNAVHLEAELTNSRLLRVHPLT